jgi:hypothetical protein
MKKLPTLLFISILAVALFSASTFPDEGMWLLTQLDKLPWQKMQQRGLALTPEQIYSETGTSLKDAIILFGGGTSSYVSAEGLVLTNHHVAFAAIQSVSSVQNDYLENGFYAKTKEEELPVPSYTAQTVVSMKDVTAEILSAVSDTMSADSRLKAINTKSREVEKAAKGTTDYECRISETFNGVKYILYTYQVLRDVRLVYAPPTAIGNYGGEIDNWYWPRHTGDFSFMRVYVSPDGKPAKYSKQNIPYKPNVFLPMSASGFKDGSFAMIMGYPGRTFRYRTTPEIQLAKNETLPLTMDLFKTRMDIITAAGNKDRAVEIQYASKWRGLANTYKNFQGTLEGMNNSHILQQRAEREKEFATFLHSKPELEKKYGNVINDIASSYDEYKTFSKKQSVLGQLLSASDVVQIARRFNDFAKTFTKDSTGEVTPNAKNLSDMKEFVAGAFKDIDLNVDKEILAAMILKGTDLPNDQHINIVQKIAGTRAGEERQKAVREFVDNLYKKSKLTTTDNCKKMLEKSADDIRDDDFIKFVTQLDNDNTPLQVQVASFNAKIARTRAKLLEAWMQWKGSDLYPDANRTLRFTYGEVKPYDPRDAVHYNSVTTLGGVMQKETGVDPFIVPTKLRELWEKKDFGRYADPALGDVPVAFLADLDITGGNSGSPVINGKGEIIGLAFDGNWEAVVGDYLFQEPLNRTINVDSRYILFVLDKFSNAQTILKELNIKGNGL